MHLRSHSAKDGRRRAPPQIAAKRQAEAPNRWVRLYVQPGLVAKQYDQTRQRDRWADVAELRAPRSSSPDAPGDEGPRNGRKNAQEAQGRFEIALSGLASSVHFCGYLVLLSFDRPGLFDDSC